jgi:hypothetical protein
MGKRKMSECLEMTGGQRRLQPLAKSAYRFDAGSDSKRG